MANEVYANTREVSCKSAKGKAVCAFPDVCLTPPPPPGVPIPYPNTGLAKDCTRGSRRVRISRKEVMLKNRSYFKTSIGDEAGCAPKKGIITSKIKGKVYFNSWSMDVRIEGQNAVRHLDVTTHNHASMPGQTPIWPYLDQQAVDAETGPCKRDIKKAKEKCQGHEKRYKSGGLKIGETQQAMCADKDCKEARKCMLSPYDPSRCCDGLTPHHVVPAHCFMPPGERGSGGPQRYAGCEGYEDKKAPCICVEGASKTADHGAIHDIFDKVEDSHLDNGQAGKWSYAQASKAGVDAASEVTGCQKNCLKEQVDAYHKNNRDSQGNGPDITPRTQLRADSSGNRALGPSVPAVAPSTVPQAVLGV